ncbi:MAG: aldehyde ferredoxin oxidoreductase C-terminal domain-containing protein [Desulfotignum sp.]|nr:aldehyde ferredoxin oxidoreductase C-terminal domain-containing protein [Desulfotignum sp.]
MFEDEPFKTREMSTAVLNNQNLNAVKFSMGLCDFWGTCGYRHHGRFSHQRTGKKDRRPKTWIWRGNIIWNLIRLFNVKAGFTASQDTVSEKILNQTLQNGPWEGKKFDADTLLEMKSLLYRMRGWDDQDTPTPEKLSELNLLDVN